MITDMFFGFVWVCHFQLLKRVCVGLFFGQFGGSNFLSVYLKGAGLQIDGSRYLVVHIIKVQI